MADDIFIEDFIKIRGAENLAPFQGIGGGTSVGGDSLTTTTDGVSDLALIAAAINGDISGTTWEQQSTTLTQQAAFMRSLATRYTTKRTLFFGHLTEVDIDSMSGEIGEAARFLYTTLEAAVSILESMASSADMLANISAENGSLRGYESRGSMLHLYTQATNGFIGSIQAAEAVFFGTESIAQDGIAVAIWNAQTAYISKESEYLTQLNNEWKAVVDELDNDDFWNSILDFFGEAIEELLSWSVGKIIAAAGITLSAGAASVVGILVSIAAGFGFGKLKDAFLNWLKEGNKLLEAMIAENDQLVLATISLANYKLRNEVITRHERTISRLLDELTKHKQAAEDAIGYSGVDLSGLEQIFRDALLRPQLTAEGEVVTDEEGNILYEGFLDERLEDLAYNDESFRVGDVEVSTRGRYVKH